MVIPNGNVLEYITSGMGFTRILQNEAIEKFSDWTNNELQRMQGYAGFQFGALFNAHTEKTFGKSLQNYRKSLSSIHADSGGLQMITRGLDIQPKHKLKVYEQQGLWSDIAMSFDEIPLQFSGDRSSRLNLENRWFDREGFEACAIQTGVNVQDQINAFKEMKSKSKPMLIVQGNCLETYIRWTELVLSQITQEDQKLIGGIAMGAAALGHGTLEDIKRAFYFTQLPIDIPRKHVHLLAVGSVTRLLPNIVFMQNGVYSDVHVSLDSTTHSSNAANGRYLLPEGAIDFPQYLDQERHTRIYNDQVRHFGKFATIEDWEFALNSNIEKCLNRFGDQELLNKVAVTIWLGQVKNFMDNAAECVKSKEALLLLSEKSKQRGAFNALYEVKNLEDFNAWERDVGRYVGSKPVASDKGSNLESFFD